MRGFFCKEQIFRSALQQRLCALLCVRCYKGTMLRLCFQGANFDARRFAKLEKVNII